jgi:hypothetical protein
MDNPHVKIRTEDGREVVILVSGGYEAHWYTDGVIKVGDYCEGRDADGHNVAGIVTEVLL